jgi:DNA-binding LacI/PurR family transcriptional regulator
MAANSRPRTAVPTMRDVAQRAGVSVQTVSNVVNGRTNEMKDDTRERVGRAMIALNYRPNVVARGLRSSVSRALAFLLLDPDPRFLVDPMTDLILGGVGDVTRQQGYGLLIQSSRGSSGTDELLAPLDEKRVDGAILYMSGDATTRQSYVRRLVERDHPFVLVADAQRGCAAVTAANYDGAYRLTRHLIERGHRRIAFVAAREPWPMIDERYAGYRAATTREHGEPDRELQLFRGFWDAATGQDLANELLSLPEPPTAIMAANDLLALGVMRAARDRGLAIPGDVAITGFNDFGFAAFIEPPLTTVAIPAYEMGRAAAEILIGELEGGAKDARRAFSVTLVERESS